MSHGAPAPSHCEGAGHAGESQVPLPLNCLGNGTFITKSASCWELGSRPQDGFSGPVILRFECSTGVLSATALALPALTVYLGTWSAYRLVSFRSP